MSIFERETVSVRFVAVSWPCACTAQPTIDKFGNVFKFSRGFKKSAMFVVVFMLAGVGGRFPVRHFAYHKLYSGDKKCELLLTSANAFF